jgi:hypothetical protein
MNNKNLRYAVESITQTNVSFGVAGANKEAIESLGDLHTIVENLGSASDGIRKKINKFLIHVRMYSNEQFAVQPLAVQTAGTITDTVDLSGHEADQNLDTAIDDLFGFQKLSPNWKQSRKVPHFDATYDFGCEFTIEIPQHLRNILNKEAETERLQNLYAVLHIIATQNSQVIRLDVLREIEFYGERKNIVLR